jgi:hypothetical protein
MAMPALGQKEGSGDTGTGQEGDTKGFTADRPSGPSSVEMTPAASAAYKKAIGLTENMVYDSATQTLAQRFGLNVLNVTWEDTGRYEGSSVGPNISDVTIQVQYWDPELKAYTLHCMPVIRYPNYTDLTADIPLDRFFILVGNEKRGQPLKKVALKEYLENPGKYMSFPESWKGGPKSLLAKRDTHMLVSAQACFLPVPKEGIAEFNPVIFNYQSYKDNPAVLVILCTREGTSMTIIDNTRDAFPAGWSWGQRLFFNAGGERASLTGQRKSEFLAAREGETTGDSVSVGSDKGKTEGLNMVMMIQVPLKYERISRQSGGIDFMVAESGAGIVKSAESDVEEAVIGHGRVEGPFTETDGLKIVRDPDFPIRVTIQFYKATSNGVVSGTDMADIVNQITRVYADADYVGSLVVDGDTGRPTAYFGDKQEPPGWWNDFWIRHQKNTGLGYNATIDLLYDLLGPDWRVPAREEEMQGMVDRARAKKKGAP